MKRQQLSNLKYSGRSGKAHPIEGILGPFIDGEIDWPV
jgi:hypothetical protein